MSPAEGGPPALRAEVLQAALRGCTLGREIIVLPETTSTNDHLLALVRPETPPGLVVFAEKQTAGRGQYGRQWESAPRLGLWFSLLLRPQLTAAETPRVTAAAAQAIAVVLQRDLSLGATVKPPNDVYVEGWKVAGVLLEMRAQAGAPHVGILGIGLNVHQPAEAFPEPLRARAASLAMLTPRDLDREQIAIALLRELDRTFSAR